MNKTDKMFDEHRILIITGAAHQSSVINAQLSEAGLKPIFVTSASKGISIIRHATECNSPIPLVLFDHELSEMNGYEFGETVRNDLLITETNIIILTADIPVRHVSRFESIGISHVLQWPCRANDLTGAIAEYIPLAENQTLETTPEPISENSAYRILCADDNAINLAVLRGFLNLAGYSPDTVADGAQAVKAYQNKDYDLILMDIMMPVMDGVVATLHIRELERRLGKSPVPIVAVTAHYTPNQRDRYIAAGMNDVIAKPIGKASIDECLEKWCQRYTPDSSNIGNSSALSAAS